jgi:hypothetical protein
VAFTQKQLRFTFNLADPRPSARVRAAAITDSVGLSGHRRTHREYGVVVSQFDLGVWTIILASDRTEPYGAGNL